MNSLVNSSKVFSSEGLPLKYSFVLIFCSGVLFSHFTTRCTAHSVHLKTDVHSPYAWLQTGPGKTRACSPDLIGAPWCWYGRTTLLHWHTPSPGRVAWLSPQPQTGALCWGESTPPCKRFQRRQALAIACPDAPYPGLSPLLFLWNEDRGGNKE